MLCETEEKYGVSFSYISYSDGYANLIAKPVFDQVVQEFVFSKVGQENAKVYSVVTNIADGAYL